jgi:hypothetical protein
MSEISYQPTQPTSEEVASIKHYKEKIQKLVKETAQTQPASANGIEKVSVVEQIDKRRKELENTAFEQDIKLKKGTFFYLVSFLVSETILIFIIAFFQGLSPFGFHLEEWTFKLLVTATIAQITAMFFMVVKHLFPEK